MGRHRINAEANEFTYPDGVFIVLFDPDTDNEGAHTIEYPKESGTNFLLAFEKKYDCQVFSNALKSTQFSDARHVTPQPQSVNYEALLDAAGSLGVTIQFIPEGT